MPPFLLPFTLVIPLLQVACAVHAYRSGKEHFWFWIILMFPLLGTVVYFIAEILPEWKRTGQPTRVMDGIPFLASRELDRLEEQLEDVPTTANQLNLAEACIRRGRPERAAELYRECLKGPHENDINILRGLAEALLAAEKWSDLLDVSDDMRPLLGDREINEVLRLEAIALDGMGHTEDAEKRYLHLIDSLPGEEIRCRLAAMLAREGRDDEARRHFDTLRRHLKRGNRYYRSKNKHWANSCATWLKQLDAKKAKP